MTLRPALTLFLQRVSSDGMTEVRSWDDDRGRNIRHDVQRENRHALHGPAREHIEQFEHALLLPGKARLESGRIDAGQRDVGAKPIG